MAMPASNRNLPGFDDNASASVFSKPWAEVLAEFENNAAVIGPNKIKFIISNHYVRYETLSWKLNVFSRQDWQSIAENHMRAVYGNIIEGWNINVSMQGYGQPIIISAIDQLLLTRLQTLAQQHNWSIAAVEPALMSVTNSYQHKMKKDSWLVIAEPQRIVLAEAKQGVWQRLSVSAPPNGQESIEVLGLIKRAISVQNKTKPMDIHFFGKDGFQPNGLLDGIKITSLVQKNMNSDTRTIMADLL